MPFEDFMLKGEASDDSDHEELMMEWEGPDSPSSESPRDSASQSLTSWKT